MKTSDVVLRWAAGAAVGAALVVAGIAILTMAGCDVGAEGPSVTSLIVDRQPPADEVVMRVDGRPVSVGEAQAYWERHPQLSREELIDALKQREALVSAGLRDGIRPMDPTLELARTRGLARAWLAREVEAKHRPEDMPKEAWEPFVDQARRELIHPAGWEVAMVELGYPTESPEGEPVPEEDEAKMREAAKVWVERVADRLGDSPAPEEMVTTTDSVNTALPPYLRAQAISTMRFADDPHAENLDEDWYRLDPRLREALLEVELEPERLTGPLPTKAGWALLLPRERIEAADATEEELEIRARAHAAVEKRRAAAEAEIERIKKGADWSIDEEAFAEALAEQAQTR